MDNIIAAVRKGSVSTMMDLFRRSAPRVWYLCGALVEREKEVSDAAASAWRWAMEQTLAGRIETGDEFQAAVLRRALAECRMRAVGRDRRLFRFPTGYSFVRPFAAGDVVRGEDRVKTVLATLPPMHRYVCLGRAVTGASPEQLAKALELSLKTVSMVLEAEEENIRRIARIMGENFSPGEFREEMEKQADRTEVPQELASRVQGDAERLSAPIRKAARRKTLAVAGAAAVVLVILAMILVPILGRSSATGDTGGSSASGSGSAGSVSSSGGGAAGSSSAAATGVTLEDAEYTAEIAVQDYGTIKVALDHDAAPKTVDNFVKLARDGFYDGLTFHRIMKGFMMQGGDPDGNGTGGSDETIPGEFSSNGVDNPLSHVRGTISMARSNDPDSASSQFFIVQEDSTFLDGEYAAFGSVLEGMDVVDAVCEAAEPTDNNGTIPPEAQPVITSITISEV